MSSRRSSCDESAVSVAWTRTYPWSSRSPSRTRTTPIGMCTCADTSATERLSQTSRIWAAGFGLASFTKEIRLHGGVLLGVRDSVCFF